MAKKKIRVTRIREDSHRTTVQITALAVKKSGNRSNKKELLKLNGKDTI